ncbi:unnamed protein product [Clonostachys rhizophaga]|uniref:Amidohydrolase-related domain-containing protein n=1 Tax=Clonostachys rhizophaga TaxID=160324 RepID=A0A9N9VDR2_9HYPO|nr:unnamed protein product [Clonostachys rhizophaga]
MSESEIKYTLIKDVTVITMDPELGVLTESDVLLKGQYIEAVGKNLTTPSDGHVEVITVSHGIVTPGFIDGHHHMWQQLIRGVCLDWSLLDYLVAIRNVYGSVFTAEDTEFSYYIAGLDLINNGITCVLEHGHIMNSPQHADAAIKGLKNSAIRGCFCYGFYENPQMDNDCTVLAGFDHTKRVADARRVRREHFQSNDPAQELLTFGIAPTEPEVEPIADTIDQITFAREIGARLITMHVAMGPYDTNHKQIVQQLAGKDLLGPDLAFSHGASLTDEELGAMQLAGAGLVGTPDTELQMGMGFPAVFRAADKGCKAGLGIDITSNQNNSFIAQMRLALQAQRALDNEKSLPFKIARKTHEMLRMGTMGGAEVMGMSHLVGSITVGKKADLNIFQCDDISTVPIINPTGTVVFQASTSNIDTVIVDGRALKRNGQLVGVDWPRLREELISRTQRIESAASKIDSAINSEKWKRHL